MVTVKMNDNKGLNEYDLFFAVKNRELGSFMTRLGLFSSRAQKLGFQIPSAMFFLLCLKEAYFRRAESVRCRNIGECGKKNSGYLCISEGRQTFYSFPGIPLEMLWKMVRIQHDDRMEHLQC